MILLIFVDKGIPSFWLQTMKKIDIFEDYIMVSISVCVGVCVWCNYMCEYEYFKSFN